VIRVLIAVFLSALVILFLMIFVVPALTEYGERGAGPFSPDARLDGSQVRIAKPDALSFALGLTFDYIEAVARLREYKIAYEVMPN